MTHTPKQTSNPSLQRKLLLWIMLCLLLVATIAGGFSFYKTYHDLNDWQRNNLKNIAMLFASAPQNRPPHFNERFRKNKDKQKARIERLLSTSLDGIKIGENASLNSTQSEMTQYDSKSDGEIRVHMIPLPLERLKPKQLKRLKKRHILKLKAGFDRVEHVNSENKKEAWQTYRINQESRIIIVRQKFGLQKTLALSGALQSFLSLLVAIIVLLITLPLLLNKLFKPVRQLSRQVANRDGQDLSPIVLIDEIHANEIHNEENHSPSMLMIPKEVEPLVAEINQLLNRVSDYINGQNRFIADASHELRSPLTAISLQVQRLQRLANPQFNPSLSCSQRLQKLHDGIDKLGVRVNHNQHLVEQLLTLARIEAGQLQTATTDLLPVLTQSIMLLLPIADNKQIELAVDNKLEDTPLANLCNQVTLDETSLMMVLKNILQNAIIYTPENGQVTVSVMSLQQLNKQQKEFQNTEQKLVSILEKNIAINTEKKAPSLKSAIYERLVVQISDTGIGIPSDSYHLAFTPFVRISQNRNIDADNEQTVQQSSDTTLKTDVKGTGLGLAIVFQICQQAGVDLYLSATNLSATNVNTFNAKNTTDKKDLSAVSKGGLTVTLVF